MKPAQHPIFRPEAVRRYLARQEEAVLPRFAAPRTFLPLWLALLGLLGAVAGLGAVQIPVYVAGQAVAVDEGLVLFVAPQALPGVAVGQRLSLRHPASVTAAVVVTAVDPPLADLGLAPAQAGSVAVALRCAEGQFCDWPADGLVSVQVARDRQRAFTRLLPQYGPERGLP